MAKYVILNDGETYTSLKSCAIYDSKTGKLYRVKKDREINLMTNQEGHHWDKGVNEIMEYEEDINEIKEKHGIDEDDGILGK